VCNIFVPQKKKTGRRENNLFDEMRDIRDVLQKNGPITLQQRGLSLTIAV
jgi:hypothetical protein